MAPRMLTTAAVGVFGLACFLSKSDAFLPAGMRRMPVQVSRSAGRARGAMFAKDPFHPQNSADTQPGVGGPMSDPETEKVDMMTDYLTQPEKAAEKYNGGPEESPVDVSANDDGQSDQKTTSKSDHKAVWVCVVCGWNYNEQYQQNKNFESEPEDFACPVCGATKDQFELDESARN